MGNSSPREGEDNSFSCLGCLRLKLPWSKDRGNTTGITRHTSSDSSNVFSSNLESVFMIKPKQRKPKGGYKYDPLSYSQNFDDGGNWDDNNHDVEDYSHRGFSSRYALHGGGSSSHGMATSKQARVQ
ncbi:hypothetical protein MKW94_015640 [Papaver nudicaule]|uniref:Uncharacterized protein n=1 Tax=Papaver nudicaule TaxID=74823 RepID=A0AA42AZR6_PAPNU|nr:hypothetical protein [Papaver nudicaule]